jgi:phosphoribosylaminoimidazole-succinocarboxamide synthase
MDDEFVNLVSERYIELYENITGQKFERADVSNVLARVENNITKFLEAYYR